MPLDSQIGTVKLYSPSSPGRPWKVAWSPPGMPRQVKDRKTKKEAEKLAREIKAQLKRGEVGRVHRASDEEYELLELCRKLADPRRILEEALENQNKFKRATVAECCDRYIDEYRDRGSVRTRDDATSKAGIIRETLGERYLDSLTSMTSKSGAIPNSKAPIAIGTISTPTFDTSSLGPGFGDSFRKGIIQPVTSRPSRSHGPSRSSGRRRT